jgi:adenylyltransferase/sulfurtransferase
VCDFDTVELSNLNRQIIHFTEDIGARKAESARDKLTRANPSTAIIPLTEQLTDGNAAGLIGNADIIIDCLDNNAARRIINAVSADKGVPLVHGAVSGFQGQIALLEPPRTACLRCFLPDIDPAGKVPVAGATAGVIGSLQAMEALKHLTGIGETLSGKLLLFDGKNMQWDSIALAKNPHCPACGHV